jgi:hypothetical protein
MKVKFIQGHIYLDFIMRFKVGTYASGSYEDVLIDDYPMAMKLKMDSDGRKMVIEDVHLDINERYAPKIKPKYATLEITEGEYREFLV